MKNEKPKKSQENIINVFQGESAEVLKWIRYNYDEYLQNRTGPDLGIKASEFVISHIGYVSTLVNLCTRQLQDVTVAIKDIMKIEDSELKRESTKVIHQSRNKDLN